MVFGQSTNTVMNGSLQPQPQPQSSYTLSSIDDVEMLTYFLLWRYGYFNTISDHHQHHNNRGKFLRIFIHFSDY